MHDRGVLLRWFIVGMGANTLWWLVTAFTFLLAGVQLSASLDLWGGLLAILWTVVRFERSRTADLASARAAR